MANYQTPGVYIEEVASLPGSIVGVPTAIPCFIGYTELHSTHVPVIDPTSNPVTYPVKIASMAEYERIFGGPNVGLTLAIAPVGGAGPDAEDWTLGTLALTPHTSKHLMHPALQHYFMNGGGPCYVVSVRSHNIPPSGVAIVDGNLLQKGIASAAFADEVTLLVLPDAVNITAGASFYAVAQAALAQCATLKDRFAILDMPGSDMVTSASVFRTGIGASDLSYGAVYGPRVDSIIPVTYREGSLTLEIAAGAATHPGGASAQFITLGEIMRFVANNPSHADTPKYLRQLSITNLRAHVESQFPGLLPSHASISTDRCYRLPPSAAIAGIISKTDRERGVWVAPANVSIAGVKAVTERYTPTQLDGFNVPTDGQGKSINVIRTVQGRGHMVMGARTLLGNSLEWRYVNVRRTFIFVEESIQLALAPVVFEPNDFATWNRVRTMIEGFLTGLWRQGALMGRKPEEAFFVKVGLGSTMTAEDILAGKLIVEVGLAAVRPAEFIILRFSHLLQQG